MGIFTGIAAGLVAGVMLKYTYGSYLQERPMRRKLKSIYKKAFKKSDKYAQEAQCSHLIQMGNLFFDLGASLMRSLSEHYPEQVGSDNQSKEERTHFTAR